MNRLTYRRMVWQAVATLAGTVHPCLAQLQVSDVIWGFDHQVVPGHFHPLSIGLVNTSPAMFQGSVVLTKQMGIGARVGPRYMRDLVLQPGEQRWVQFYPYVQGGGETWRVHWGRGAARRFDLPEPRAGNRAAVLLTEGGGGSSLASGMRAYPQRLFPTNLGATDALRAVVLDHQPRWEPTRRQTLVQWLQNGGEVHVIHGPGGVYPRFTDELSVLNINRDQQPVGRGLVRRHPLRRQRIDVAWRQRWGLAQAKPQSADHVAAIHNMQSAAMFFNNLKALTQPVHSWSMFYLIGVAYLLIIGPINWLVGRRRSCLVATTFALGTIGVFSLAYFHFGSRGYDEASTVQTLTYARSINDQVLDLQQWTNVFVATSGYYEITHKSPYNLYTTYYDTEPVNGRVYSGVGGRFDVDMPLYSTREFMRRGQVRGGKLIDRVVSLKLADEPDPRLTSLGIRTGPDMPKKIVAAWAVVGRRTYTLQHRGDGRLMLAGGTQTGGLESLVDQPYWHWRQWGNQNSYAMMMVQGRPRHEVQQHVFQEMAKVMIVGAMGAYFDGQHVQLPSVVDADNVHVFVLAESPSEYGITDNMPGYEVGYTVYHLPIAANPEH